MSPEAVPLHTDCDIFTTVFYGTAMAKAIRILGRHTSYNVQKVLWLADELSLQYEHIQTGGRFGGTDSKEFLAINPHGKVPVLVDRERAIVESNTIIRYIADVYGKGIWNASEPFERTLTDRWLDWSIDRLERAFVAVFWGYYRTPPEKRDSDAIDRAVSECEDCLLALSAQLGLKPYLIGAHPTLADIATGVFLHRLYSIELPVTLPDNVFQWYQRLSRRQPYNKWVMSDFSELKGRVGY